MKFVKYMQILVFILIPAGMDGASSPKASTSESLSSCVISFFTSERRQANLIDIALDSAIAKIANDYLIHNARMSVLTSIGCGTCGWIAGEFAEMMYKYIYQRLTGKSLRSALGTSNVLGVEIDNQRLIRRIFVAGGLCLALYMYGSAI